MSHPKMELSSAKKRLFFVITLLIPVLFFALIEGGLRLVNYGGDLRLFIPIEWRGKQYIGLNPSFTKRFFFRNQMSPTPSTDIFLAEKPKNGFRLFVMGGSTAAGYPYGHNAMLSRVVKDVLDDVAPSQHIEVISLGISAINTYTLYDMLDELMEAQPDAILIYAGHNEYYGALGVGSAENLGVFPGFVRFFLRIQRLKTFLALRDIYASILKAFAPKTDQSSTLMQRVVAKQIIPYHSDLYQLGLHQFYSNMNAILERINPEKTPVFIGSLASNLRDHFPFRSVENDSFPRADSLFLQAQRLLVSDEPKQAFPLFEKAKNVDALRFRASDDLNAFIRNLDTRKGVHFVDIEQTFNEAAQHHIPGNDLFLEHLHPNADGYFLMGQAFAQALLQHKPSTLNLEPNKLKPWMDYKRQRFLSEFDHDLVKHRLAVLMGNWPFTNTTFNRERYFRNYKPQSKADSLALLVAHSKAHWNDAKTELARYYATQGDFDRMEEEYLGLSRDDVYNHSFFLEMGNAYLQQNQLDKAYLPIKKAHSIQNTFFTTKMLGILEITQNRPQRAIELLEQAEQQQPHDAQLLYNLSGAYGKNGQFEKAKQVLDKLKQINPRFPGLKEWETQLNLLTHS